MSPLNVHHCAVPKERHPVSRVNQMGQAGTMLLGWGQLLGCRGGALAPLLCCVCPPSCG